MPRWGLRIHSLDRDPAMPHLARCLDEHEMAERLLPLWKGRNEGHGDGLRGVECRPLSYRAGRRAAISYRSRASNEAADRFVGKTYFDGRGKRLLRLHDELDRREP